MEGKSHLLVGLTAGVVLDSFLHISGPPLTAGQSVTLGLLADKTVYYFAVGFGALLPDIDNARSIMGRRLGVISREIQHIAGHRTVFHSLLGLAVGALLALGLERVVIYLLDQRNLQVPAAIVDGSHLVFFGVLFGCIMHIAADALTRGGVPLLWPNDKRFGFPPKAKWRFNTGTWPEHVIVWTFIILVSIAVWQTILTI